MSFRRIRELLGLTTPLKQLPPARMEVSDEYEILGIGATTEHPLDRV